MTDTRTSAARRPADPPAGERPDRAAAGSWPVRERSMLRPVLGIPPVVAVALALGLTAAGVFVDLLRLGTVGTVFQLGYGAGCVLAVAWVRRRSIFLPAIQPPLLLVVVVPVLAVLVGAPAPTAGAAEHLLLAGAPLINAFPAMAVTTGLVLLLAGFRLLRQRTGPDDAVGRLRSRLSGDRGPAPDADSPARRTASGRGPSRGTGRSSGRETARPGTEQNPTPGAAARRSGGSRDSGSRDSGSRDSGSRDSGARDSGARKRADGAWTRSGGARDASSSGSTRDPGRPDAGRGSSARRSGRPGASGRAGTSGRDGDTTSGGRNGKPRSGRPDRRSRPAPDDPGRPRRPRRD